KQLRSDHMYTRKTMKYKKCIPYILMAGFILYFNQFINYDNLNLKTYLNYSESLSIINHHDSSSIYNNNQDSETQNLSKFINNEDLKSHMKNISNVSYDNENEISFPNKISTMAENLKPSLGNQILQTDPTSVNPISLSSNGSRLCKQVQEWYRGEPDPAPQEGKNGETKVIVIYTKFYGTNWHRFPGFNHFACENCKEQRCKFTFDRKQAATADAVLFSANDFNYTDIPKVRSRSQRYIWYNMEAPGTGTLRSCGFNRRLLEADRFGADGFFNWTITYHSDSDITDLYGALRDIYEPSPHKHAGFLDRNTPAFSAYSATINSFSFAKDDAEKSSIIKSVLSDLLQQRIATRTKTVLWIVSHCVTDSGRELYVSELQQYLPVDIYGLCGPLSCGRNHLDTYCFQQLAEKYYFYLAFENNMCNDYITEKVWNPMEFGMVPVVYGGANYSHFLPPHSYIDATNMQPKELAQLMK
ncbi:unnamed protein product, partial [Meganyctiphanes norvegica]